MLKPAGAVLVRSTFAGRIGDPWWRQFFPRSWAIEEAIFPTVAELAELFRAAGLASAELVEVEQPFEGTVGEAADRFRLRAISLFEQLDAHEIEEGFARMDSALARGEAPTPESELLDLVVLRAC